MIPTFLTAMPKVVLALLTTVAITGGAVGVSAAVGGPNLPAQALHAVGVHNRGDQDEHLAAGTPSATGTAAAAEFLGLCRADQSGSAQGQAQKQDAVAFQRLAKAAGSQTVAQFCAPILSASDKGNENQQDGANHPNANASDGRNASDKGDNRTVPPTGKPTGTATATDSGVARSSDAAANGSDHAAPSASPGSGNGR